MYIQKESLLFYFILFIIIIIGFFFPQKKNVIAKQKYIKVSTRGQTSSTTNSGQTLDTIQASWSTFDI